MDVVVRYIKFYNLIWTKFFFWTKTRKKLCAPEYLWLFFLLDAYTEFASPVNQKFAYELHTLRHSTDISFDHPKEKEKPRIT